jgi:acid phosphatase type 7
MCVKSRAPSRPDFQRRRLLRMGVAGATALILPGCLGSCGRREVPPAEGIAGNQSPHGVVVSFTGDPKTTRTVTWITDGLEDPGTTLEFDAGAAGLEAPFEHSARGTASSIYGVESLAHRATMTDLDPKLPIRYRVGSDKGWSPVRVLAPAPASTSAFRFCHFGDHGMTTYSRANTAQVAARHPDLFLLAGDLSYANGKQWLWNPYFDQLEPLSANVPVMMCPGNHEQEDSGGRSYKTRVTHPDPGAYYAFDYGNVRFVVSTAGCLADDGLLRKEMEFMEAELAEASARRAAGKIDFVAVVQHYTTWSDERFRRPNNPTLVKLEEDMLVRYGVDLLIDGHDHVYQRSVPFAYGVPDPAGYVQVGNGVGGAGVRGFAGRQQWSAKQSLHYGFTEYDVDGRTIRATAWAVGEKRGAVFAAPKIVDQFEVTARSPAARNEFVRPIVAPEVRLADYESVLRHTLARNRAHLRGEHLAA